MPKYPITKEIKKDLKQIAKDLVFCPEFQINAQGGLVFRTLYQKMLGSELIRLNIAKEGKVDPNKYYWTEARKGINHEKRVIDAYKQNGNQGVVDYLHKLKAMVQRVTEYEQKLQEQKELAKAKAKEIGGF